MKKIVIYVDMDDTLCIYKRKWHEMRERYPDIMYPQSQVGFFEHLEPVEYALSCMAMLLEDDRFEVWISTAPSIKNTRCYMEKAEWIKANFGEELLHRMIITPDKSKLIGDVLIDDYDKGKGQDEFQGTLIHFGSEKFKTWVDVVTFLTTEYAL